MLFKKEDLLELDELNVNDTSEFSNLKLIERGKWISDGKYDYSTTTFEYNGKFYQVSDNRTGSYYTDYCYDHKFWKDQVECSEVEKVEVIKYEWRVKQ